MRSAIARSRLRLDCAARCGVKLDPVLARQGWRMHPACEFPEASFRRGNPPWPRPKGRARARKTTR